MDGATRLPSLVGALAPLLLQSLAYGQFFSFVPTSFKTQTRMCSLDGDCGGSGDMVCWLVYEGCNIGQCMCHPQTHVLNPNGRCLRVRRVNEACDGSNDTCTNLLECVNGTCQCPFSHHLFSSLCIHPNARLLGSRCNPSTDVCYHESAYGLAGGEVECSRRGVCQCREGYKQDSRTCRRLLIWESGCKRDYHCEGGAVCVDEQCACPTGYKSVAGNTKCAKVGAILELPLKARCDEINERGYCSQGLVCHKCKPTEATHTCARYLLGLQADKSSLHSGISVFRIQAKYLIITFSVCMYLITESR